MGLRPEDSIFPNVPTNPQPSDLGSPIPGQDASQMLEQMDIDVAGAVAPLRAISQEFQPGFQQAEEELGVDVSDIRQRFAGGNLPDPKQIEERLLSQTSPETINSPPGSKVTQEQKLSDDEILSEAGVNDFLLTGMGDIERTAAKTQQPDNGTFESALAEFQADIPPRFADEDRNVITGQEFIDNPGQAMGDFIKNTFARVRGGLGRNEKEFINAVQSTYGSENVKKKDGQLFVKRRPGEEFVPLDPAGFEFMMDVFGDMSGPIIEGSVAIGVEALIAGTAIGEVFLSAGAMTPIAVAQIVGGAAVAGAAGAGARKEAIKFLDVLSDKKQLDKEISDISEAMWGAGLNLVGLGALTVVKRTIKRVVRSSAEAIENFIKAKGTIVEGVTGEGGKALKVTGRVKELAKAQNFLDDLAGNFGLGKGTSPLVNVLIKDERRKSLQQGVFGANGVIDKLGLDLDDSIRVVREDVEQMAGKKTFEAADGVAKLKEILEDNGARFDDNGLAFLPKTRIPIAEGDTVAREALEAEIEIGAKGADDATKFREFATPEERFALGGAESSQRAINELAKDFNILHSATQTNGGVSIKNLLGIIGRYSSRAKLGIDPITKFKFNRFEIKNFRDLQNAFRGDRSKIFNEVLGAGNSPLKTTWEKAFTRYSDNIAAVSRFGQEFSNMESARTWAQVFFTPGNATSIKQLKGLLGAESQQWNNLRNGWLINEIEKSTSASDGILRSKELTAKLFSAKGFDSETLNELLTLPQQKAMRRALGKVEKIPFTDLIAPRDGVSSMIKDIFIVFGNSLPTTKAGVINRWMKNSQVTEEVMEALRVQVRAAGTKTERLRALKVLNGVEDFMERSDKVKVIRKHPETGKRVVTEMWVPRSTPGSVFTGQVLKGAKRGAEDQGPTPEQEVLLNPEAGQQEFEFGAAQ